MSGISDSALAPSRSSSVKFMSTTIAARVRSARVPRAATQPPPSRGVPGMAGMGRRQVAGMGRGVRRQVRRDLPPARGQHGDRGRGVRDCARWAELRMLRGGPIGGRPCEKSDASLADDTPAPFVSCTAARSNEPARPQRRAFSLPALRTNAVAPAAAVAAEVHEVFRSGKPPRAQAAHRAMPAQRFPGLESASAWC